MRHHVCQTLCCLPRVINVICRDSWNIYSCTPLTIDLSTRLWGVNTYCQSRVMTIKKLKQLYRLLSWFWKLTALFSSISIVGVCIDISFSQKLPLFCFYGSWSWYKSFCLFYSTTWSAWLSRMVMWSWVTDFVIGQ